MGFGAFLGPIGDIIGAGLSLVGNNATNQANKDIAGQANLTQQQQMQMEEEFAKNGISWRIQDAARYGISPLAALGASEPSYSPVASVMAQSPVSPYTVAGSAVRDLGQDLGRAVSAQASAEEKLSQKLDLARKAKENDLIDLQIQNAKNNLLKQTPVPGIPKSYELRMNRDGTTSYVPTHGGEFLGPLKWSFHNGLMPAVDDAVRYLDVPDEMKSRWWKEDKQEVP